MPKLQPELHERYWDRNRLKAQKPCAGSCLDGGHRGCFGRGQATEGNLLTRLSRPLLREL